MQRSVLRDVVATIVVSGLAACVVLVAWSAWSLWVTPTGETRTALAFIAEVFSASQRGLAAIVVCCAIAIVGVVGTIRRFRDSLTQFQDTLARMPTMRSKSDATQPRATNYHEAQALARAVDDVQKAFSERESRFERSKLRLRDQLNQRTQEANEAGARAYQLAMVDPLTKLPNRAMLNEALDSAIADALSHRTTACVLFIDVDHFKRLNDTLGHELGDRVLQHVATTLRTNLREIDSAARLGGDEFVVVIRNLPLESAKSIVERYLGNVYTALRNPIDVGDRSTLVTLSIGAALYPSDGNDGPALLRAADAAMYVAKQKGRNRADWYVKERERSAADVSKREQALREAIANRQLVVAYQPQVRADDGIPVGLEALVRWQHPTSGLIMPGEFISLAEKSGLIVPLGQRVLEQAFTHAKRWNARDLNMRISVNLSIRQLEQQGWTESLQLLLEKFDLSPGMIDLEITESVISDDPVAMEKTLRKLSERGFTLSLDDFGTGFSSLNYLARFPFDHVKIDRQFINDIGSEASRNVVQSIIALGHTLKMRTIAEGVETPQQFRILREMGCDEIQGFFVAEAMPADEVLGWWQQRVETTQFLSQQEAMLGVENVHPISAGRSTSAMQP